MQAVIERDGNPIPIYIEATIIDLNAEQTRHFKGNLEFWNEESGVLITGPPLGAIARPTVKEALRVGFRGWYEPDDDDFKVRRSSARRHRIWASSQFSDGGQSPMRVFAIACSPYRLAGAEP